jgi:hypothetical protein
MIENDNPIVISQELRLKLGLGLGRLIREAFSDEAWRAFEQRSGDEIRAALADESLMADALVCGALALIELGGPDGN